MNPIYEVIYYRYQETMPIIQKGHSWRSRVLIPTSDPGGSLVLAVHRGAVLLAKVKVLPVIVYL